MRKQAQKCMYFVQSHKTLYPSRLYDISHQMSGSEIMVHVEYWREWSLDHLRIPQGQKNIYTELRHGFLVHWADIFTDDTEVIEIKLVVTLGISGGID